MRIDLTRSKTYEVAYPYDGNALDTSNILREHYWPHRDIDFLKKTPKKNELFVYGGRSYWGSRRSDFCPNEQISASGYGK